MICTYIIILYIYIHSLIFSLEGRAWQEPEPGHVTGMALAHCILGKFLRVVCHCFPPPLDVPTLAARYIYIYIQCTISYRTWFLELLCFISHNDNTSNHYLHDNTHTAARTTCVLLTIILQSPHLLS